MSDQQPVGPPAEATRTGVPAVDEVLTSVDQLADRPLDEHAAVFEQAHDRLRRALDEVDPRPGAGAVEPGL